MERSSRPGRLGILAGGGALPRRLIEACRAQGREVYVIAFEGQTDPQTATMAEHLWTRLAAAGEILEALREKGVSEIVLAGPVRRPSLAQLRPDRRAVVTVVPVVEERWVYRQQYSSTYKFTIVPERALVVNWSFSDPAGKSDCDLYLTFKKKIKATN